MDHQEDFTFGPNFFWEPYFLGLKKFPTFLAVKGGGGKIAEKKIWALISKKNYLAHCPTWHE